ncbi:MAG: EamA family transporter RarD [Candidatus Nanopelagicaceae bacterium]|jgi:chloramphenicol-sensitive protein RarD
MSRYRTGLIYGISSYTLWGLFPLYWPLLKPATPIEMVSHRAVWSLVFCLIVLAISNQLKSTFALAIKPGVFWRLTLAAVLISINWITYIWAVNHEQIVQASLGYYMQPILLVLMGIIAFKEEMRKIQWISFLVATVGVIILTIDYGRPPLVSFALAFSWSSYSFVKKKINLGSLEGLAIETLISSVFYGAYLIWIGQRGEGQFGHGVGLTALLIGAGLVTAIPLLLFNGATLRIPFTTMGLLQYLTPTIQFMLAVFLRHEPMPSARWLGFVFIWIALITLGYDLIKSGSPRNNGLAQPE